MANAHIPELPMRRVSMRTSLALLAALSLVLALSWAPLTAHAGRPIPAHVQVLVVGGSPAGIAAAVAAARARMTTVLVEPREEIGGVITPFLVCTPPPPPAPPRRKVDLAVIFETATRVRQDVPLWPA